jgi:deazaflavin-dependent oxidoreductase (nitroreductase family)
MVSIEWDRIDSPVNRTPRPFPAPETMISSLITQPDFKLAFHQKFKANNRLMVFLYELRILPLFGVGKQVMLLTTREQGSGKMRVFPLGYYRIAGIVTVFSGWGKETDWYFNLLAYPDDVYVQAGFHRFHARPEIIDNTQKLKRVIEWFVHHNPAEAQDLFGWDTQQDEIEKTDFSLMVEKGITIRFHERMVKN